MADLDMVECPGGCGKPIVRRRWDRAALNMDLSRHRCLGPIRDEEDAYQRDLAEATALGVWPWSRAGWERHQEEVRRRIEAQNAEDERLEALRWAHGEPGRDAGAHAEAAG